MATTRTLEYRIDVTQTGAENFSNLVRDVQRLGQASSTTARALGGIDPTPLEHTKTAAEGADEGMAGLGEQAGDTGEEFKKLPPTLEEVEKAFRTLGVRSQAELEATANNAVAAYHTIRQNGTASAREVDAAWAAAAKAAVEANGGVVTEHLKTQAASRGLRIEVDKTGKAIVTSLDHAGDATADLQSKFSAVTKAVAGLFAAAQLKQFAGDAIQTADAFGQMAERVRMATADQEEFNLVQGRLLETANTTYRALAEQQEMYIRSADALRSLGYTTEDVLDITDSYSYLLATNAASQERATNAVDAYTKAVQAGKIDADSWASIMAATPTVVDAIAQATGKTTEEIRRLGVTGKLSIDDLNEGLRQTVAVNREATEGMATTVNDALTKLRNTWGEFLRSANEASGATEQLASLIGAVADNIEELVQIATVAGKLMLAVFGAKALMAVRAYGAATLAAAKSQLELANNLTRTQAAATATAAVLSRLSTVLKGAGWLIAAELVTRYVSEVWNVYDAEKTLREATELNAATQVDAADRMVESLARISRETGVVVTSYEELTAAINDGRIVADEASGQWLSAEQALARVGKAAGQTDTQIRNIRTTSAIEEFRRLTEGAAEAGDTAEDVVERVVKAFEQLAKSVNFSDAVQVDAYINTMARLEATGTATAQQVSAAWDATLEKLSGDQLSLLSQGVQQAFAEIRLGADQTAQLNDKILSASFEALGVTAAQALGKVSQQAQTAIGHLRNIATNIAATGMDAEKAGAAIEQAFLGALKQADSVEAVAALREEMGRLVAAEQLSEAQQTRLTDALSKHQQAIAQTTPAVQALAQARQRNADATENEIEADLIAERGRQQSITAEAEMLRQKASLARARGDHREAIELEMQAQERQIDAQRAGLEIAALELDLTQQRILSAMAEAQASGELTAEKEREYQLELQKLDLERQAIAQKSKLLSLQQQEIRTARQAAQQAGDDVEKISDASVQVGRVIQSSWSNATIESSKYAAAAKAHADEVAGQWWEGSRRVIMGWDEFWRVQAVHQNRLRELAEEYIAVRERLDAQDAALDRRESSRMQSLKSRQMQLLQISGTQEEIREAERASEREALQIEQARLQIAIQRARVNGDTEAATRAQEDLALLQQELQLIDQIYAAEDKKRRDEERAAKAAQQQAEAEAQRSQRETQTPARAPDSGATATRASGIVQTHRIELGGTTYEIPTTAAGGHSINDFLRALERAKGAAA